MRAMRGSLPDPRVDDDEPVRDGRRQPGGLDLRKAGPARAVARRHDPGPAPPGRGCHRRRLLPWQRHREWPSAPTDFGCLQVITHLAADTIARTSTGEA